jgi:glycosyltransferase involved in cell wall biosynthesis
VNAPQISIVTPCLNRARFLGEAIESVLAQKQAGVEHIIVDGMSTDGTVELLARYPHLRVIREPDRSLYDALNKGLRAARGEFIGIINSDDLYAPGAFSRVAAAVHEYDVISGGVHVFKDEKTVLRDALTPGEIELHLRNVFSGIPNLNARFFRRSLVERVGEFDLAFSIAADRDWLFRALLTRPRELVVPELFYRYRQHPDSLTFNDGDRSALTYREEHAAFAEKHLAGPGLPPSVRRQLRSYHTRESATVAALHLKFGRGRQTWHWATRGWAQNRLWPWSFARRLVGQALGR